MIGSRTSYGGIRRASHAEGCVCRSSEPDRAEGGVAGETITITIKRKVARDFLAEPTWGNADSIERASKSVRRSIRAALEGEK